MRRDLYVMALYKCPVYVCICILEKENVEILTPTQNAGTRPVGLA